MHIHNEENLRMIKVNVISSSLMGLIITNYYVLLNTNGGS